MVSLSKQHFVKNVKINWVEKASEQFFFRQKVKNDRKEDGPHTPRFFFRALIS